MLKSHATAIQVKGELAPAGKMIRNVSRPPARDKGATQRCTTMIICPALVLTSK